ncbi:hypothetical protein NGB36_15270 [Streptomyces sp. RB6PN25]|uniref:Uncharacterized protein n=1 Tax=Streptomyces humicola TaxID=2953240 RepID=A0ABT1PW83_9ACTN|nr:hypothetical protein [Streptomyces humicola]MCQ4081933.1 hypothetical protein [Streptomyces humicola]
MFPMHHLAALLADASADSQQGPGTLLRVVIVVAVLGAAFLAWFLLRGYGDKD